MKQVLKKVIYFTDEDKINEAFEQIDIKGFQGKNIPFKLHMGEKGNKYFPRPDFVKKVVEILKNNDIKPFLFDTTVAYQAKRNTVEGYEELVEKHGFSPKKMGCNVKIDDTGKMKRLEDWEFEVADTLVSSSHIFCFSHVKGHIATGMGGAIKNFGMGGVTKETKIKMHHASRPEYQKDKCTYCGVCAEVCPFDAIDVENNKWDISERKCFGCGVCVDNCEKGAITNQDKNLQYLLALSAKACTDGKNVLYLNDVNRIAKGCDCDPYAGPVICPDIGYLLSDDPVAIDKASLDLINNVKLDVFKKQNNVDPEKQIRYGEEIGLGSSEYQLVEL